MNRNHIAYKTIKSYVAEGMSKLEDNDCHPIVDALKLIVADFEYVFKLGEMHRAGATYEEILKVKKEWLPDYIPPEERK